MSCNLDLAANPVSTDSISPSSGDLGKPRIREENRIDLLIHLINLLQSQALGLVNHKIHECDAQEAAGEPDEEDLALKIGVAGTEIHQIRRGVGDGPIEEPIGGGCH